MLFFAFYCIIMIIINLILRFRLIFRFRFRLRLRRWSFSISCCFSFFKEFRFEGAFFQNQLKIIISLNSHSHCRFSSSFSFQTSFISSNLSLNCHHLRVKLDPHFTKIIQTLFTPLPNLILLTLLLLIILLLLPALLTIYIMLHFNLTKFYLTTGSKSMERRV